MVNEMRIEINGVTQWGQTRLISYRASHQTGKAKTVAEYIFLIQSDYQCKFPNERSNRHSDICDGRGPLFCGTLRARASIIEFRGDARMSETKSPNDWVNDWQALQRQYLNAWSDLAQKSPFNAAPTGFAGMPGAMPSFGTPPAWHEGLEQWSRMFGGANKQSETAERVLESAKSYMAMVQGMFGAATAQHAGAASAQANPAQAWLDAMRAGFAAPAGFNVPGVDAAMLNNPFTKALRDIVGHGAQGFGQLPASIAPFVEQMRQEGLSWLRMPAFGVGREHQEHYQKTVLAFVEYQQALNQYNQLMLKAGKRGFEKLEDKLADRGEPGRTIDSVRALYDLWVDCAEEAYAEIALSDEFAKVYGELANAQMRVRAQIQAEVERIGTDLGMPTRSELNSVHQRLHDLRREVRDGKGAQIDTSELEAEIATLRAEMRQLKQVQSRAQQSAPAAAPKAAAAHVTAKPETPAHVLPRKRTQRRVRAVPKLKARVPAPVVKPRPVAVPNDKSADKEKGTFGDAIAAMRQRVAGKSRKLKAVAADMSKPSKRNDESERADKKSRKRKK